MLTVIVLASFVTFGQEGSTTHNIESRLTSIENPVHIQSGEYYFMLEHDDIIKAYKNSPMKNWVLAILASKAKHEISDLIDQVETYASDLDRNTDFENVIAELLDNGEVIISTLDRKCVKRVTITERSNEGVFDAMERHLAPDIPVCFHCIGCPAF